MTDEQRARLALYGHRSGTVQRIVWDEPEALMRSGRAWDETTVIQDARPAFGRNTPPTSSPKDWADWMYWYGGSGGHDLQRLDQRRRSKDA